MALQKISTLFGVPAPDEAVIEVPENVGGPVPTKKIHVFDPFILKLLILWHSDRTPRRNLLLTGNGGVGKTASFLQFAARMNIPVWSLGVSGKTRYEHMVGSMQMIDGRTYFKDGPLLSPWRNGGTFLGNEITRMDSGEQMRCVDALDDNGSITVAETGEVVPRHPNFRFAATGNSGGFGDESGAYAGEKVSSYAFLDRFITEEVKPLPEEAEIDLVKKIAPNLTDDIVRGMVTLARTVRDSFVGNGGALRITISPRALCDWACMIGELSSMKGIKPIGKALELIVLNGKPKEDRDVIVELYEKWIPGELVG